jgi:hypothetical protein
LKADCHFLNSPPFVPYLSRINSADHLQIDLFKVHFNIIVPSNLGFQSDLFPSGFPTKTLYALPLAPMRATYLVKNQRRHRLHFFNNVYGRRFTLHKAEWCLVTGCSYQLQCSFLDWFNRFLQDRPKDLRYDGTINCIYLKEKESVVQMRYYLQGNAPDLSFKFQAACDIQV